jgi:prevent-host-death family protein
MLLLAGLTNTLSFCGRMKTFTISEAKTNLSKLIEAACHGEEVVIACGLEPVVRLVPLLT